MSKYDKRISDSHLPEWVEASPSHDDSFEILRLAAAHAQANEEATAAVIRQLNGPLTALLIYIGEIKEHSHLFPEAGGNRAYMRQVVDNAMQQTERVCELVKQIAHPQDRTAVVSRRPVGAEASIGHARAPVRAEAAMFSSSSGQKPLTKREREVLDLISEGYSNKQGALRMGISPRTFESHRAEAMRKLGARNTADLVRKALAHRDAE
jgi:DNA-binding CsgD family transcriptional regulator